MDTFFNRLACYDMVSDDENIYCYDNEKNVLYKIDKRTKECQILLELNKDLSNSYSSIQKNGNKIILIPWCAKDIVIYDLMAEKSKKIYLNESDIKYKFWDAFSYGENVFLLGYFYPAIIKINMVSLEMVYLTDWKKIIESRKSGRVDGFFIHGEVVNNDAWISCGVTNLMIKLDLKEMIFQYYEILLLEGGCGAFTYDGEAFWIGERGNRFENLIYWNPNKNKTESIKLLENSNRKWCPIHSIVSYQNTIIVFPFANSCIYEVEKKSRKVFKSSINTYCDCNIYNIEKWKILSLFREKNCITFVTGDFIWHEFDLNNRTHRSYKIEIEDMRLVINSFSIRLNRNKTVYEEKGFLDVFLKYISCKDDGM